MKIEAESNVGLCGIKISASIKQSEIQKLAEKSLPYILWHDGASAVFAGGKKAKFARDSAYTDELGKHADAMIRKVLSPYFKIENLETFAHVKQSEEQKFMKFCKSLGMSEEQAAAGWKTAQENAKPVEEPKAEKVLE